MKLQLTPDLLKFLSSQGFKYCLSRTMVLSENDYVNIVLTPIATRPRIRSLSMDHDTYFAISREPAQMAQGIDDDTLVLVDLDRLTLIGYLRSRIKPVLSGKKRIAIRVHVAN